MSFRFTGLAAGQFAPLFALSDAELEARGMRRIIADEDGGFPCRVSLADAAPGEVLILLPFEHQPAARSPYRASGPIFVRQKALTTAEVAEGLPDVLKGRLLSLRAYDGEDLIVDAEVVQDSDAPAVIERFFARDDVSYIHVHNARRGCYACRVDRA